jgi:hypothetical protein
MKPADAYEAVDHADVLAVKPRHVRPCSGHGIRGGATPQKRRSVRRERTAAA